jgi:hypothetical protein
MENDDPYAYSNELWPSQAVNWNEIMTVVLSQVFCSQIALVLSGSVLQAWE